VSVLTAPTIQHVHDAATRLDGIARRTPVIKDNLLDEVSGSTLTVKAEFLQRGGAYKFRGIYNKIALLDPEERQQGIVTVSSGNAGIAAAYAARLHQTTCQIVMPAVPAEHKAEAINDLGGEVIRHGSTSTEMFEHAQTLVDSGRIFVHPFDQPQVIAGQATIALELLDQAPDIEVVVVPTAGGGMLAGMALVLSDCHPELELIGVQPDGAASLHRSLRVGFVEEWPNPDTLADALLVKRCGELTFELIKKRVDDVVLVSDDAILAAVAAYWRVLHVAVEPAGAATLAAVLGQERFRNRRVGVIASGANIDPRLLHHALEGRTADEWKRGQARG
jgi:threonine dehydratase